VKFFSSAADGDGIPQEKRGRCSGQDHDYVGGKSKKVHELMVKKNTTTVRTKRQG